MYKCIVLWNHIELLISLHNLPVDLSYRTLKTLCESSSWQWKNFLMFWIQVFWGWQFLVKVSILWHFGHNFWTRNTRKLFKGSKEWDFSLVCTKNVSEILVLCGWDPGPDNLGQKCLNIPHLWRHPQKTQILKKIFSLQTTRLTESFQSLNSSLSQSTGEWLSCKDLTNTGKLYLLKQNSGVKHNGFLVWIQQGLTLLLHGAKQNV